METVCRTVPIDAAVLRAAEAAIGPGVPVIMINLLRFRDVAAYEAGSGDEPCSGRDAYYKRYAPGATPLVMQMGGSVFWSGTTLAHLIAPHYEHWDDVLLVQYPEISCLVRLFDNPDYQAIMHHRTAALEDSRLIATRTMTGMFEGN
jgi:uncharacterized protein (DUF1330 family)